MIDWRLWIFRALHAQLDRIETHMSALDDKIAELEAAASANHAAITAELAQLAAAVAAQAPDLSPQVARLAALVDNIKADTAALKADDPPAP